MEKYNIYEWLLPEMKTILLLRNYKIWSPQCCYHCFIMSLPHHSQPVSPDGSYKHPFQTTTLPS